MIERNIEKTLELFHDNDEIICIVGPRRAGKTTVLTNHMQKLVKKGLNVNLITFEDQEILDLFEENINNFIEYYIKPYDVVFIDEVQYAKDGGKHLKFIYDTVKIKLYLSGSSASELSLHSTKFLVGRVLIFNLYPLNFEEFLRFKDDKLYDLYSKKTFNGIILDKINSYLVEFMTYGGYPQVVIENNVEKKKVLLKNIYETYLLKEIKEILQYREEIKLKKLMKVLSIQVGGIIEYQHLSQISGYNQYSLKEGLEILEQTFIIKPLYPFYTNKLVELVKNPKMYFIDFGLRNHIFGTYELSSIDTGEMFENFVYQEFIKKDVELKFWRNKTKAEVDFVIEKGLEIIPIEIKKNQLNTSSTRSYLSFIEKYRCDKGYILSLDFEAKRTINSHILIFLPLVKLNLIIDNLN